MLNTRCRDHQERRRLCQFLGHEQLTVVARLGHHAVPSVVEVLKILDKSPLDVEQEILQHTVLQRSSLQDPELAEQLVEVLTPLSQTEGKCR